MKNYLNYMNFYRGFAICMIVFVHCTTKYLDKESAYYPFVYAFFGHSTNLFLFISGFLFEYLLIKNYSYSEFISKKVRRLLVPYLFWALPVSIIIFVIKKFDFSYLLYTLWTGLGHFNNAHWYIPFILLIFAISPIYVYLQKIKLLYLLVLPIALGITLFTWRARTDIFYSEFNVISLIGMFFLGMFFSHYRTVVMEKYYKYDWLLLLLGGAICVYQGMFEPKDPLKLQDAYLALISCGELPFNFFAFNKIFLSVGFLFLFYRIGLYISRIVILEKLAHYSFGIYFIHFYIIRFYNKILEHSPLQISKGLFLFFFSFVVIMLLSTSLLFVFRNIKYTKNIIGV